jgi:S-adenosylmethionine-dependent methyltransferase
MKVLDLVAGTGVMAKHLWELGHDLTLVDILKKSLAIAKQQFDSSERVNFVQTSLQALPEVESYDLVICHAVLEWLQSPLSALKSLLKPVKRDGLVSLSFFNKDALIFANLLYGNFDYVAGGLNNKNQVRLNPSNPVQPEEVLHVLDRLGAEIMLSAGVRCFHDYLKHPEQQKTHYQQLLEMELAYADKAPFKWLGKYFHVLFKPCKK